MFKCLEFSRYVLDSLEEKVLKGKYGFIAQLNPNRWKTLQIRV